MGDAAASHLLSQFGLALGVPELQYTPDGVCHLLIDHRHLVQIVHHPRGYILMSCPLPTQTPDAQLQGSLLRANDGQAAGGVVFTYGSDGRFHAQLALPAIQADTHQLLELLETLIAEVERWER